MTREEDRTPKEQVEPAFANETAGFNPAAAVHTRATQRRAQPSQQPPSAKHIMTIAGGILSVVLLSAHIQPGGSAAPRIELRSGEPVLVLPEAMETALRTFDPDFKVRQLTDYPAMLWRRGCTPSPECARLLYRFNPRETPFAVIGDFNGDRVLDVAIDGDNQKTGRRLVILSSRRTFQASEIEPLARIANDIEASRANKGAVRDWESGIGEGLSGAKPSTYRTPHEPQPLVLTTDGFVVSYYEKAAVLHYFRDGRWRTFILSD